MEFNKKSEKIIFNIILTILSICMVIPFVMLVSASLSSESDIAKFGYRLFPIKIDLAAYQYVFRNPKAMLDAYKVTAITSVSATLGIVINELMLGYAITRKDFKARNFFSIAMFITMLFSGGLVPSYILITRYLHLQDTIWVYIVPAVVPSAWQVFMVRTFMNGVSYSLIEAAKIDGASEFRTFWNIMIPLMKPVIATIAFTHFMGYWNSWMTSMLYINTKTELFTVQYLLQSIMNNIDLISSNKSYSDLATKIQIPTESVRFAMTVLIAFPVLIVFPFFQKYFQKGMIVGSVKG